VFGEVGLVSGLVRPDLVRVVTLKAMSSLFWVLFGEVGFVPGRVRRGRLIVGTCLAR